MDFDFSIPEHQTLGLLNGEDLRFFYYDIGMDNMTNWPQCYNWDEVVEKFKDKLSLIPCSEEEVAGPWEPNTIRFTVSKKADSDYGSPSVAFFRHLRNAFAHYRVVRELENYVLTDKNGSNFTMKGIVNADMLKRFCYSFSEFREKILSDMEDSMNSNFELI